MASHESEQERGVNYRMGIYGNAIIGFLVGSAVFDVLLAPLAGPAQEYFSVVVGGKLFLAGIIALMRADLPNRPGTNRGLFIGFVAALGQELLSDGFSLAALGMTALAFLEGFRVVRDVKELESRSQLIASKQ